MKNLYLQIAFLVLIANIPSVVSTMDKCETEGLVLDTSANECRTCTDKRVTFGVCKAPCIWYTENVKCQDSEISCFRKGQGFENTKNECSDCKTPQSSQTCTAIKNCTWKTQAQVCDFEKNADYCALKNKIYDAASNDCQACPSYQFFDGVSKCLSCKDATQSQCQNQPVICSWNQAETKCFSVPSQAYCATEHQIYNATSKLCQSCPAYQFFDGTSACVECEKATESQCQAETTVCTFNTQTKVCTTTPSVAFCATKKEIYNTTSKQCEACPSYQFFDGTSACVACESLADEKSCKTEANICSFNSTTKKCFTTPTQAYCASQKQAFDATKKVCVACESFQFFDGTSACVECEKATPDQCQAHKTECAFDTTKKVCSTIPNQDLCTFKRQAFSKNACVNCTDVDLTACPANKACFSDTKNKQCVLLKNQADCTPQQQTVNQTSNECESCSSLTTTCNPTLCDTNKDTKKCEDKPCSEFTAQQDCEILSAKCLWSTKDKNCGSKNSNGSIVLSFFMIIIALMI